VAVPFTVRVHERGWVSGGPSLGFHAVFDSVRAFQNPEGDPVVVLAKGFGPGSPLHRD
jgi:hypothetical protein